ncbi:MAG: thiamine diphosphokinase [Clostridia bacterium]|nr:thiamine diphosphokinase [Clostridia bacterium]
MKCFIFGSAPIESYAFLKKTDFNNAFVICADGGIKHAEVLGITPDVWLGDGDSLLGASIKVKERYDFPVRKDNTDTDLAVELALERGYKDITILGGIGGRRDHEFSHFCLLKKILERGGTGCLIDEKNEITMKDKSFVLHRSDNKYVSFFPFGGDVTNFSVKGLRYEAEGIVLRCGEVQASSNCFDKNCEAHITFDKGFVLVICSND